jgi:hypothetical protein
MAQGHISLSLYGFGPRLDPKIVLNDFPSGCLHVRGFPREDVLFHAEKVDECAFLFGE